MVYIVYGTGFSPLSVSTRSTARLDFHFCFCSFAECCCLFVCWNWKDKARGVLNWKLTVIIESCRDKKELCCWNMKILWRTLWCDSTRWFGFPQPFHDAVWHSIVSFRLSINLVVLLFVFRCSLLVVSGRGK